MPVRTTRLDSNGDDVELSHHTRNATGQTRPYIKEDSQGNVTMQNPIFRPTQNWGADDPLTRIMAHRLSCGLGAVPPAAVQLVRQRQRQNKSRMLSIAQSRSGGEDSSDEHKISIKDEQPEDRRPWSLGSAIEQLPTFGSSNADPSLIFAMERTFFGAVNQAMILTVRLQQGLPPAKHAPRRPF